ncbi:MFS transporter [Euhalothece natronophila]|nr:MFS transporter [Euhalothece natronophila]
MSLSTKFSYGIGEFAGEVTASVLVFFLLFFLTNVAGLSAGLAGTVLLIARAWDAINDPLIGWLSDRTQSRWGRRYPWMVIAAIPLAISFALIWWVPPLSGQALFLYYCGLAFIFHIAFTSVVLPYTTLGAELTEYYNERTSLISYKAGFSVTGSMLGLLIMQGTISVVDDPARQYFIAGSICGAIAALSTYICVFGTYKRFKLLQKKRTEVSRPPTLPIQQQIRIALSNRPFLFVVGIYLCSWLGLQVTASMLPYFVVNWMGLEENHFTQMAITVQGTGLLVMAGWNYLGQRWGKRKVYCTAIPLTLIAQAGLFLLQPGQVVAMYGLAVLAGAGLAVAYLIPWSMLPDVVDLDELETGQRREGIFYGFVVQLQKIAVAIALFMVGRILDAAGLVSANGEDIAADVAQPDSALLAIRWLIGPIPSLVLIGGIIFAWMYPITREFHEEILLKLSERKREQTQ